MAIYLILLQSIIFCCWFIDSGVANEHRVFRVKYYGSSAQLITSDTLVWESFIGGDEKQLEYAVEGAKYYTPTQIEQPLPTYICRHLIEAVYVPGFTIKENGRTLCLLSMSSEIHTRSNFDILINKGHGAKLVWKSWSKLSGRLPDGVISASTIGHMDDPMVARYKFSHHSDNEVILGWDYLVGRLDPFSGLGRIIVTDGEKIHDHEKGELLVEIEPLEYILQDISLDKWRRRVERNETQLAFSVLKNEDSDVTSLVESVVTYEYRREDYYEKLEGVANGLPLKIYETKEPINTTWGVEHKQSVLETKIISAQLPPNTAVNVTVIGNYTRIRAPYKATLLAYYNDNELGKLRKVEGNVRKATLQDVEIRYSPIYWLNNGTLVPTTTPPTTTVSITDNEIQYESSSTLGKQNVAKQTTRTQTQSIGGESKTVGSTGSRDFCVSKATPVMLVAVLVVMLVNVS